MGQEERIICCDWGTSNFRLYLVDTLDFKILYEVTSDKGVSDIYRAYSAQASKSQEYFFSKFLNEQIDKLGEEAQEDISGKPVMASGMASSTIGLTDVAYAVLPFSLIDPQLNYKKIDASIVCGHDIYVFGGLRSTDDVMRGEEVQLLGLIDTIEIKRSICILPGTHSKHVQIEEGVVTHFDTFMTGELFHLLVNHSILKNSIEAKSKLTEEERKVFVAGVLHGASMNPLKAMFKIRTRDILNKASHPSNFFYLSGMLIGSELQELKGVDDDIILCGGDNLARYYKIALHTLYENKLVTVVSSQAMKSAIPQAHTSLNKKFINTSR